MRIITKCIFCKQDSTDSQSVEHIIPESLGNDELILDKGIVCDKCNNYFSREIEGPVSNLDGFRRLRFYELIESKRGRIPSNYALLCGDECIVHWQEINGEYCLMLGMSPETVDKFINNPPDMFLTKSIDLDDKEHEYEISRFLAKVAIEYYVYLHLQEYANSDEELDLNFDEQLSKIIKYVRLGRKDKKALEYEVSVHGEYRPLSGSPIEMEIGFSMEANELIFNLTIANTSFKLNLSKIKA